MNEDSGMSSPLTSLSALSDEEREQEDFVAPPVKTFDITQLRAAMASVPRLFVCTMLTLEQQALCTMHSKGPFDLGEAPTLNAGVVSPAPKRKAAIRASSDSTKAGSEPSSKGLSARTAVTPSANGVAQVMSQATTCLT